MVAKSKDIKNTLNKECYMIININELQTHTSTWMYLNNMLSEIIMSQENTQCDFIYINSNCKKKLNYLLMMDIWKRKLQRKKKKKTRNPGDFKTNFSIVSACRRGKGKYSKSSTCKWIPFQEHIHKSNLFLSPKLA